MRWMHACVVGLSLLYASSALAAPERLRFVYRASEIANLARHLDCLAEVGFCDRDAYQEAWKVGWSAEDETAIREWKKLIERYQGHTFDVDHGGDLPAPHLFEYTEVESFGKLRVAALESDSLEEWERRLELVTLSRDAERFVEIARRFEARFHAYWKREAGPAAKQFASAFGRAVERGGLNRLTERVAQFYGADVPSGHRFVFHFIYQPRSKNPHTYAEVIDNHALVEIRADEKPEDRIAVVMHEAFHHLYGSASPEHHQRLVERFAQSADPMTFGYYNLLNEAVAAALGNGLVERAINPKGFDAYLAKPESFVSDSFKDRAAKAILPLLEQTLSTGGQLTDEGFIEAYIERVRAGLGDLADAPLLLLRIGLVGIPSNELKPYKRLLQRRIVPVMLSTLMPLAGAFVEELAARPEQSAAILLRPKDLSAPGALRPVLGQAGYEELLKAQGRAAPYLFVAQRTPRAKVFVFVASTPDELSRLADEFVTLPRAGAGFVPLFEPTTNRVKPLIH